MLLQFKRTTVEKLGGKCDVTCYRMMNKYFIYGSQTSYSKKKLSLNCYKIVLFVHIWIFTAGILLKHHTM